MNTKLRSKETLWEAREPQKPFGFGEPSGCREEETPREARLEEEAVERLGSERVSPAWGRERAEG